MFASVCLCVCVFMFASVCLLVCVRAHSFECVCACACFFCAVRVCVWLCAHVFVCESVKAMAQLKQGSLPCARVAPVWDCASICICMPCCWLSMPPLRMHVHQRPLSYAWIWVPAPPFPSLPLMPARDDRTLVMWVRDTKDATAEEEAQGGWRRPQMGGA